VVPLRKKLIKGDDKSDVPSDFFAERNCREKDAVTSARFCLRVILSILGVLEKKAPEEVSPS
jgi:hypothetical protein